MERSAWTRTGEGGLVHSTARHCEEGQNEDSELCPWRKRTCGGRTAALCTYAECLSKTIQNNNPECDMQMVP